MADKSSAKTASNAQGKETAKPPRSRRIEPTGSESAPVFYANHVGLHLNRSDFLLSFYQIRSTEADEEKVPARAQALVFLSPQLYVAVTEMMVKNLVAYEAQFGKIERSNP